MKGQMSWHFAQSDAVRLPLGDQSVDVTFASPPYMDARSYGIRAQRRCVAVVSEAQRVTRGPVLIVAAGVTRKRNYWPGCEGLMWEWWNRGGNCELYRPCFWNRVGIPGSGGKDWFRADVEYVMCFKRPGALPWSDNTACGHPPKWGPGGEMSYRNAEGKRLNQWGGTGSANGFDKRFKRGSESPEGSKTDRPSHKFSGGGTKTGEQLSNRETAFPVLANPGNLVKVIVGGGVMGSKLCHENEAPFPEALAEFFIKSLCPPGGTVLDMFSGSGTTVDAANRLGRVGIGFDVRMNQCELGRRRLLEPINPPKPQQQTKIRPKEPDLFTVEV